ESLSGMLFLASASCLLTLLILRLWRESRARAKNEPPILPYWVPFLGHVFRFSKSSQDLYLAVRDFLPESKPVSLTILGQRLYVVIADKDIAAVHRCKSLQFTPIMVRGLQNAFNMSKEGVRIFLHEPDGPQSSLEASMHSFYHDALKEGPGLDDYTRRFVRALRDQLHNFDQKNLPRVGKCEPIELYEWVKSHFGISSTAAIMGKEIMGYKPDLLDGLWRFEANFPKLTLGLPRWVFEKENVNREEMVAAFRHVYEQNMQNGALWWITERQKLAAKAGFSPYDLSVMTFGLWVASEINAKAASFWLLVHSLYTPGLVERIRSETAYAFSEGVDDTKIGQLVHDVPILRSMYHEVLRFCSSSISFRTVMEDTNLCDYTLRKGAIVLCPTLPRHFDTAVWGPDALSFVPDRFIRPSKDGILKGNEKLVRAFGGGTSLCPGRYFAAQEVVAFVAIALERYDFNSVARIPSVDKSAPVVGMLGPSENFHVKIKLRN
ncbi:cytochrome P450, partial [Hymenopellis radicata]